MWTHRGIRLIQLSFVRQNWLEWSWNLKRFWLQTDFYFLFPLSESKILRLYFLPPEFRKKTIKHVLGIVRKLFFVRFILFSTFLQFRILKSLIVFIEISGWNSKKCTFFRLSDLILYIEFLSFFNSLLYPIHLDDWSTVFSGAEYCLLHSNSSSVTTEPPFLPTLTVLESGTSYSVHVTYLSRCKGLWVSTDRGTKSSKMRPVALERLQCGSDF